MSVRDDIITVVFDDPEDETRHSLLSAHAGVIGLVMPWDLLDEIRSRVRWDVEMTLGACVEGMMIHEMGLELL